MEKNFNEKDSELTETQKGTKFSKGKGKAKNNKRKGKPSNGKAKGNVNDTAYYYTDPNVLASVTNFSFTEFLGVPVEFGKIANAYDINEEVANIVAIKMNPSVQPTNTDGNTGYEAINVVGMRNYTNLTAGNGKTSNYGSADPTIAVLAIGSAISMYSHIKRAFNSYQLVNQRNREYPRLLFKAMGIDWDDFKANIANYRDQFNLLVCQFDKIPMFDSITYLDKCKHMYEYIYVDEDSPLAQTYMFVPYSVWTLDEAYDPAGSGLVTTKLYDSPWAAGNNSMQTLLDVFSTQISRLTSSSTLNLVYSDILRLIQNGKGKAFLLETIPLMPDPKFAPIINDEIRHWLNNMMLVGAPVDKDAVPASISRGGTNSNDVCCDGNTGMVLYHPTFVFAQADEALDVVATEIGSLVSSNLVNFDSMSPSIDDKVAALRLAVRGKVLRAIDGTTNYVYSNQLDLGDYYAVAMTVWSRTDKSVLNENSNIMWYNESNANNRLITFSKVSDVLAKIKYAPRFQLIDAHLNFVGDNQLIATTGDLTYYTMIPHELTTRIKDAEMFGLFDFRL